MSFLRLVVLVVFLLALVPTPALANPDTHMLMNTGTYTGNATDNRQITGVGFQPDVVFIKGDLGQVGVFRTSTMADGYSKPASGGTAPFTNRIKSFQSDGFTIGTDADVNKGSPAKEYYWVAFKAAAGELKVGSYTGDGNTTQDITGVGFQPNYVVVMSSAGQATVHATSTMSGGTSWQYNGNNLTDGITAMLTDGFRVGINARVNYSARTYYYIAWKAVTGKMAVGTYTGDGIDDRSITGVGFQPEWLIIHQEEGTADTRHKPASTGASTDASQYFTGSANETNRIQALEADGFQVGSAIQVNNSSGYTYHYMAFNSMWDSFQSSAHSAVWGTIANPYTGSYSTAYMYGDGFTAGHTYSIGFYDGNGDKVGSDVSGTLSGTELSAQFALTTDSGAMAGTWHAVVFDTGYSPPSTYAATSGAAGYVVEDDFEVAQSAIPEFSTVFAAIVVAGLSFGIYYWMRKRRLGLVVSRQ